MSPTSGLSDPSVPTPSLGPPTASATAPAAFHSISAIQLNGEHTDIVLHRFADKICLLITQYERLANVFVAHANSLHNGTARTFREIEHRFGPDSDELSSAVRHLVTAVPELNEASVDVVVSLALRHIDGPVLRQLVAALQQLM